MAKPILIIGGVDYAPYLKELKPTSNGLNADGSGRDVQTGTMTRVKITDKLTFEASLDRIYEDDLLSLQSVLKQTSYQATVLDPDTGRQVSKSFYTDTRPFGSQRYDKATQKTYYDGISFKMTEI